MLESNSRLHFSRCLLAAVLASPIAAGLALATGCSDTVPREMQDVLVDVPLEWECDDLIADVNQPFPQVEFTWASLSDPPVAFRPWVRWWWPGNDVKLAELQREVQLLAEHGFGGAEVQPFNAALNPSAPPEELARRLSWDSPEFYENLRGMLDEARRVGLEIDLNLGSGWASGGMHISAKDSLRTLVFSENEVTGPKTVTLALTQPDRPAFYEVSEMAAGFGEPLARYLPEEAVLVAVVAGRVTGGLRDPNPFVITDSIELDASDIRLLTDRVNSDGLLTWAVPAGKWLVVAFFQMPTGEFPSLIAQPQPGFVVNHLDKARFLPNLDQLLGERTGLEPYFGNPLKGFFNDSFELKAERLWTEDLFHEFQQRRGYDLVPWLPAVVSPGADNHIFDGGGIQTVSPFTLSSEDGRIRYDYARTVSDLFIERFVETCTAFAEERGLTSRLQGYGIGIDVIRGSGSAHMPEAEQLYAGGTHLFLKVVSSGAHLYNRTVTSAESMVWAVRDYLLTPMKIKVSADKLFASGVNRILFHGFPYRVDQPEVYGDVGWSAFSSPFSGMGTYSSNVSPASPFWGHMKTLNRYLSRVQYLLQQGRPDTDLLVYYPWLGVPGSLGRMEDHDELLFQGSFFDLEGATGTNPLFAIVDTVFGEKDFGASGDWLRGVWSALLSLEDHGYSWDFVNDHSLADARFVQGKIDVRGNRYKALLILDAPHMDVATARNLETLAADGATIVFSNRVPDRQPGFHDFQTRDRQVQQAVERVAQAPTSKVIGLDTDIASTLIDLGASPSITWNSRASGLRHVARNLGDGRRIIFVWNPSQSPVTGQLTTGFDCDSAVWLDLFHQRWEAAAPEAEMLPYRLAGLESRVLLCGFDAVALFGFAEVQAQDSLSHASESLELTGSWTLDVTGPDVANDEQHYQASLPQLVSWLEIPELAWCSSPGLYSTTVTVQGPPPDNRVLDLGWFSGIAEISVNGAFAGTLLVPPFRLHVGELLVAGENLIEVRYTPPLRNRLIGLGNSGDPRYVQFRKKDGTRGKTGLLGPAPHGTPVPHTANPT